MNDSGLKKIAVFISGFLVVMFLVWFGVKLLLVEASPSATEYAVVGLGCLMGAVVVIASQTKNNVIWGFSLLLVSLYYFLKSTGVINGSWLVTLSGFASLVAAFLLMATLLSYGQGPKRKY